MARKKNTGIGSVYYNKARNNWTAYFYITDPQSKEEKRIRKSFPTETEAKEFLKMIQYKKQNEIFILKNSIPLYELMKAIIEKKYKMGKIGSHQYGKSLRLIEKIKANGLGEKDIAEITSEDLQEYFNSLNHYSDNYMGKFIEQISGAFKYAHNKGFININPMVDTFRPKSNIITKKLRSLEIEEQQKLTNYLKNKTIDEEPYKNVFLIQIYTGLRIGEVTALQDEDIDLKNNMIHVHQTLARDEEEHLYLKDTTKTPAGDRYIPIQPIILEELKEQKELSRKNFDNMLFVSSDKRTFADPKGLNKILKRIMINLCKVIDITTHCLRHTFGTRCIESGMSPVVVQRLMGHSDIRVTLNVYTSVLNKFKLEELEKLNNYYKTNNLFKNNDDLEK